MTLEKVYAGIETARKALSEVEGSYPTARQSLLVREGIEALDEAREEVDRVVVLIRGVAQDVAVALEAGRP